DTGNLSREPSISSSALTIPNGKSQLIWLLNGERKSRSKPGVPVLKKPPRPNPPGPPAKPPCPIPKIVFKVCCKLDEPCAPPRCGGEKPPFGGRPKNLPFPLWGSPSSCPTTPLKRPPRPPMPSKRSTPLYPSARLSSELSLLLPT